MVSSRAETCLDLPSLSRSGVSVVSALVNRGFLCLCRSLCFLISLSGVVCRLCGLLCSVVSHATEQRWVACYRAAFFLFVVFVGIICPACVRPYCALSSFRDDDVDVDDDECPSVAILAQETSVRFSPQALNTAFYAQ